MTTVRVQKFDERFLFNSSPTSSLFSFEIQDTLSHQWRPVLMWLVDGDLPIQRQQVKFVTDSVVYAFGNAKYVVTTDAGKTWSEWDAKKALPNPEAYAINEVVVSPDGTGSMIVKRRTEESQSLAELGTSDFGVHWSLNGGRKQ